jgi:hypothetical protein
VTLVATIALVIATAQLATYVGVHGKLHTGMAAVWLLYAAVAVTGFKAFVERHS